jgi:hypothetical protein
MATDEQKKANMYRLAKLTLYGLTTGIWDLLGEGALGLSHEIGDQILPVLEKEMGLELGGDSLLDIANEVGRIAVDEFGAAEDVEVSGDNDKVVLKIRGYALYRLFDDLAAFGITHPFICPFLCVGDAILDHKGVKAIGSVEKWEKGKGSIITWELI